MKHNDKNKLEKSKPSQEEQKIASMWSDDQA